MTIDHSPDLDQIQCFTTAAYPCSYLKGHTARSQVASPYDQIDSRTYSDLVELGFRRSGGFVYRPHCDHCQACLSVRIPVAEFVPDRSQRRAWARHGQLTAQVSRPSFSEEHYALYQRYQRARHPQGDMDQDGIAQYVEFLLSSRVNSYLVEFRGADSLGGPGELKMVSVIDQLRDGLSAVYTFFDPCPGESYGTFNVLWQINRTKALGLTYLYLGYWISSCRKMSYKARFQPYELLIQGLWTRDCATTGSMTPLFTR